MSRRVSATQNLEELSSIIGFSRSCASSRASFRPGPGSRHCYGVISITEVKVEV